jgi:magnesium-transporting ATPase (P-type)
MVPAALIVLAERVRSDVVRTLRYFADQGISLKVISGDSPQTVVAVADAAGVLGAGTSISGPELPADHLALEKVVERSSVFARVTPHQKRDIIEALRRRGHVVAMVGDGVNDLLALKQADLGIAVGSGASACRAIAQLVLVDGSLAALLRVVTEGRRVIANVERTAKLFVTKTSYVLLMALAVALANVEFPFLPRHLTLIGSFTIGIPAFFLALAPNALRSRPGFVIRTLRFSIPAGCTAAAATLVAYALTRQLFPVDLSVARTAAVISLTICGLSILTYLGRSTAAWVGLLIVALSIGLGAILALAPARAFFALAVPPQSLWLAIGAITITTHIVLGRLTRTSQESGMPRH